MLVVYNWTRPRDLSHYETFHHYHATAYQHVEALSVTPFSKGAVHRGLSGVFASAVRLMGADLNRNEGAGQFATMHAFTQRAIRAIRSRAAEVASEAEANDVEAQLKHRADQWAHRVSNTAGAALVYKKKSGTQAGLLHSPEEETWSTFTCLNSLREVEPTAKLILNTRGFGDGQNKPETPLELMDGAAAEAETFLTSSGDSEGRLRRVAELIEGYETPFGMELLSTVHWVATHDEDAGRSDESAVTAVHAWNTRKATTMKPEHVRAAWKHLRAQGWI